MDGREFADGCRGVVQARCPEGKDLSLGRAIFGCMRSKLGQGAGEFGTCDYAFAIQKGSRQSRRRPVVETSDRNLKQNSGGDVRGPSRRSRNHLSGFTEPAAPLEFAPSCV